MQYIIISYEKVTEKFWAENGSDILYKNDIFASWGINDFGIENEKLILFETQNQYYIHDIIPNYSEDIDDMETFYSISNDIGNYIKKLANQN